MLPTTDHPPHTLLPAGVREKLIEASKIKNSLQRLDEIERIEAAARAAHPQLFRPVPLYG